MFKMPYIEAQMYLSMKVHPEASYMEAFDDFPIDKIWEIQEIHNLTQDSHSKS